MSGVMDAARVPSHAPTGRVLSLVERGWHAARLCSLELGQRGIDVLHVNKGRLSRDVRALIPSRPRIRIMGVARPLFWPLLWTLVVWWTLTGQLRAVLVDNDRSYRRVRGWLRGCVRWGAGPRLRAQRVAIVREASNGYELWGHGERLTMAGWCEQVGPA